MAGSSRPSRESRWPVPERGSLIYALTIGRREAEHVAGNIEAVLDGHAAGVYDEDRLRAQLVFALQSLRIIAETNTNALEK
jgi:hypothetical protein